MYLIDTHVAGTINLLLYKYFLIHLKFRKRLGNDCPSQTRAFSDPLYASLSKLSTAGRKRSFRPWRSLI